MSGGYLEECFFGICKLIILLFSLKLVKCILKNWSKYSCVLMFDVPFCDNWNSVKISSQPVYSMGVFIAKKPV